MPKKLTIKEVKEYIEGEDGNRCKLLSKEYINIHSKLIIICNCGNIFEATFAKFKHRNKKQCNNCGLKNVPRKQCFTHEEFIDKVKNKYQDEFEILDIYIDMKTKLKIRHNVCNNIFEVLPHYLLNHAVCINCSDVNRYNYEEVKNYIEVESNSGCKLLSKEYKNSKQKLILKCCCGNIFKVSFANFKAQNKYLCNECSNKKHGDNIKFKYHEVKQFIEGADGNGCKLVSDNYIKSRNYIFIKCKCGNIFKTTFNHFKNYDKRQCNICKGSKGEKRIGKFLSKNNIFYITQKHFKGLLGLKNGNLSYDFYLPQFNLLIEYQGEQHEKFINGFHESYKDFEVQLEHDRRKHEYTKQYNINFLEIWYWDFDNIETILNNYLN